MQPQTEHSSASSRSCSSRPVEEWNRVELSVISLDYSQITQDYFAGGGDTGAHSNAPPLEFCQRGADSKTPKRKSNWTVGKDGRCRETKAAVDFGNVFLPSVSPFRLESVCYSSCPRRYSSNGWLPASNEIEGAEQAVGGTGREDASATAGERNITALRQVSSSLVSRFTDNHDFTGQLGVKISSESQSLNRIQ